MPSEIQEPVKGHKYRFKLFSGAVIVGTYRGRFREQRTAPYYYVIQTKGRNNKGFSAAYNANRISSITAL